MSPVVERLRQTSALAFAVLLATGSAVLSQDKFRFQEGSFPAAGSSTGNPAATQPAVDPTASADGNGAGSFDAGSFGTGTQEQTTEPEQQSDNAGGQAGSFADTDWATGGAAAPEQRPSDTTETPPVDTRPVRPSPEQTDQTTPPEQQTASVPAIPPEIVAFETREFGVSPSRQLRSDSFHAPTPTELPGGSLVSTQALAEAFAAGLPMLIVDVLGGVYTLPDAMVATGMAQGGHYSDRVQQQTGQWLERLAKHGKQTPVIVYCSDPMCWLSYNAALRAIAAGYTNVYWYRGGIQAWQMAGLKVVPAGF